LRTPRTRQLADGKPYVAVQREDEEGEEEAAEDDEDDDEADEDRTD
jgi:hypothetical protein